MPTTMVERPTAAIGQLTWPCSASLATVRRIAKNPTPPGVSIPKQTRHLRGDDQQPRRCGEADDHAVRDEIDQHSHPAETERELHHAGEEGDRQCELYVVRRERLGDRRELREEQNGKRIGRPRDQVHGGAEQRGDHGWNHRRVQPIFRRQAGERCESDALRQNDDRADESGDRVCAQRPAIDPTRPGEEGEKTYERRQARSIEHVSACRP